MDRNARQTVRAIGAVSTSAAGAANQKRQMVLRSFTICRDRLPGLALLVGCAVHDLPGAVGHHGVAPVMGVLWQVGIGIAAVIVVVGATLLWWWVPKWQMRSVTTGDPKARADVEDNFRKTVGQALGGAAVLIGAGAAYLQFTQQQRDSHDLLISNQVSKGFEQLAAKDNLTMRLGGIYALEGVMNTSDQYHQPVLEGLCAFVRENTKDRAGEDPPATDIQAALTVIGRRKEGPGEVDLIGAKVPKARKRQHAPT
jgi:hypothetical protein